MHSSISLSSFGLNSFFPLWFDQHFYKERERQTIPKGHSNSQGKKSTTVTDDVMSKNE